MRLVGALAVLLAAVAAVRAAGRSYIVRMRDHADSQQVDALASFVARRHRDVRTSMKGLVCACLLSMVIRELARCAGAVREALGHAHADVRAPAVQGLHRERRVPRDVHGAAGASLCLPSSSTRR